MDYLKESSCNNEEKTKKLEEDSHHQIVDKDVKLNLVDCIPLTSSKLINSTSSIHQINISATNPTTKSVMMNEEMEKIYLTKKLKFYNSWSNLFQAMKFISSNNCKGETILLQPGIYKEHLNLLPTISSNISPLRIVGGGSHPSETILVLGYDIEVEDGGFLVLQNLTIQRDGKYGFTIDQIIRKIHQSSNDDHHQLLLSQSLTSSCSSNSNENDENLSNPNLQRNNIRSIISFLLSLDLNLIKKIQNSKYHNQLLKMKQILSEKSCPLIQVSNSSKLKVFFYD